MTRDAAQSPPTSHSSWSCYYGADGALQKVPISATPLPKKKGGPRG